MKNETSISITAVAVAAIIGLSILGYGFLNYQTKIQTLKIENDKEEQNKRELELIKQSEMSIRQTCAENANESAADLLKTKSKLPGGAQYKDAAEQDLFLKEDFNTYYEKCLSSNGLK